MMIFILSVLRADFAILFVLKDSKVKLYSPFACPSVSITKMLVPSYSLKEINESCSSEPP